MITIKKSAGIIGLLLIAPLPVSIAQPIAEPQTIDLFENFGFFNATNHLPIDAVSFANYGRFVVEDSLLPFDMQNVLNFTNRGIMTSSIGFDFKHITPDGARSPAKNFVNARSSEIVATPVGLESDPSYLLIDAENIINQGRLSVGAGGLMQIDGDDVNLFNSLIEIHPIQGIGTLNIGTNEFLPDSGLVDVYWGGFGSEENNLIVSDSSSIISQAGNALLVRSPVHFVNYDAGDFLPPPLFPEQLTLQNPSAFAISNALTESNVVIQSVFAVMGDPEIQTFARFSPSLRSNAISTAILEMVVPITNVVRGETDLFTLYLSDTLAWESSSNHVMLQNANGITRRPYTYQLSRVEPSDWFSAGLPDPEVEIVPELLWADTYSNIFVTNIFAAYSAVVDNQVTPEIFEDSPPEENRQGHVEITAKNLNMNNARFRGEGLISIQAEHLQDSRGAILDSQNMSFNLASTNGVLDVRDLGKTSIRRFNGQLRAFSMVWTNQYGSVSEMEEMNPDTGESTTTSTTNVVNVFHHVLLVDGTRLSTSIPVSTHDFIANGQSVTVNDSMNILRSFESDAEVFTNQGELFFEDTLPNFGTTNLPQVREFVNHGSFTIFEIADFGFERGTPLERFVNSGSITAFSPKIAADYFENRGDISGGGRVLLKSGTAKMEGGSISSGRDIDISGQDVKLRNCQILSGLRLGIDVSGTLTDSGAGSNNRISVGDGFTLRRRPEAGDLFGTVIRSSISRFLQVDHFWAAEDRGPSREGFRNNAALGHLQLAGPVGSQARFASSAETGAMYVEFLEFSDSFENAGAESLVIDEGMVVYFADSNLPVESLDGAHEGRLQWVREFAGANSSVDVVVSETGETIQVNRALRESLTIDSDGDGTANGIDLAPFDGVVLTDFQIETTAESVLTTLSWMAAAQTEYRLEYRSAFGDDAWHILKKVVNEAPIRQRITVSDALPRGKGARFYRVTYLP